MGWAGGSELADEIWGMFRKHVPANQRKRLAKKLVDIFEGQDCDTMDECEQLMKDAGLENRWADDE